MSRFHKIFLASVLVVVGFGVAKFLGQPVLPLRALDSREAVAQSKPITNQSASPNFIQARAAGTARLLPEAPPARAEMVSTNTAMATPQPPTLGPSLGPVFATNQPADVSATTPASDFVPIASAPIIENTAPRARLRNEAPLPVGVDPHSPAVIRRMPATSPDDNATTTSANQQSATASWPAPQLLNAGYPDAGSPPPTAVAASFNTPIPSQVEAQAAPPPWPTPEQDDEPQTHTIVDGDSLEKLAGLYLSDAHRSREIYELNRDVLSAPDLLPIGAKLKLPERLASSSSPWRSQGFQPNSANAASPRAAGFSNPTPIQPASLPQRIIPRAQLSSPVMVQ